MDGGYRVSGRKIFASQSPVGAVMATMFPFEDPSAACASLNLAVPFNDGCLVHDNWDTLGMPARRATTSRSTTCSSLTKRVLADRPYGVVDPPLQIVASIAFPIVGAVYLGVAESAATAAIAGVSGTPRANDPSVQRQVGLMRNRLQVAVWALEGAFGAVGDDRAVDGDGGAVMAAKREVANAGIEVCDLAMEIAGGRVLQGLHDRAGLPRHPRHQVPSLQQRDDPAARRTPRPRAALTRSDAATAESPRQRVERRHE